jgi:basic membrane lipoprotein Med (substrate-binding protein (PBP1-ABC) superfamily)
VPVPAVAGAVLEHGTLDQVAGDPLVLVPAGTPAAARLAEVAAANPSTHFALVGGSARDLRLRNVAGLVIPDDQAARLAGIVAGVVAADLGVAQPSVAWAGRQQPALLGAFGRGVHAVDGSAVILHAWTRDVPASCKEGALAVIQRGAAVVAAPHGNCALAAASGAHEQDVPALSLDDFQVRSVPAAQVVRDAVNGLFHGGEDLVFGTASGAVAVDGGLDPRITPDEAIRARTAAGEAASGVAPSG